MDAEFEAAAAEVKTFTKRPTNDELLQLYGLYKQATVGDNNTAQPWAIQMEASAKWHAWNKLKAFCIEVHVVLSPEVCALYMFVRQIRRVNIAGTSQEDAKKQYVELVNRLRPLYK